MLFARFGRDAAVGQREERTQVVADVLDGLRGGTRVSFWTKEERGEEGVSARETRWWRDDGGAPWVIVSEERSLRVDVR